MSDEDLAVEQEDQAEAAEKEMSDEERAMAKLKEAITVEKEDLGGLRMKLTVTVPRETIDERMGDQFAELKREAMIPGFRKGHAPLRLVEKRFATDVGQELKGKLVGNGYLAAVEKEDLKPLGDPQVWVTVEEERVGDDDKPRVVEVDKLVAFGQALDHITLPKEGALTFSCEVELRPEFELPRLDKIPVEKPIVSVVDEDIENEIRKMRMMRGTFEPVEKGGVVRDDLLYAAMKMTVDGETIMSDDNFDLAARDINIRGVSLEGFGDAVVGRKIDDTITFEATVPDNHENADLRGKKAEFAFTIQEIKRLQLPPIDDAFLSGLGFSSEKELRETIRASLQNEVGRIVARRMREQIADYLIEKTRIEIPAGLSKRQTERSVARRMMEMYQAGAAQVEIDRAADEMRAKAHDQTVHDLKLFFVLEKIAEERDVEVKEEEINGAIAQMARRSGKRFDRVRDELSKGDGLSTLYLRIRDDKILEQLLADAAVTETEGPKKERSTKAAKKSGGAKSGKKTAKAAAKKTTASKKSKKKTAKRRET